jgi:ParB family chromosome partitioning protein
MPLTQQTFDEGAQDSQREGTLEQATSPVSGDVAALEAALIESSAAPKLNLVERARAYAELMRELGLTPEQVGKRVGRSKSTVESQVRLLHLSDEILGFLEQEKMGLRHARALLTVNDLEVRDRLARGAAEEGWSVEALEARIYGKPKKRKQDLDGAARGVAKAWGDVLGVEVDVRTLPHGGGFQVAICFNSSKAALAKAVHLGEVRS